MEGTMKARLLLTTALFLFVQIPTMQGQVTVDVVKITCQQIVMGELPWTQRDVVLWLSGYYHGKRNSTIVEPETITKDEEKVTQYCYQHRDTTFMDAVKIVLGLDK
jgi:acid stress chaperone HdeB